MIQKRCLSNERGQNYDEHLAIFPNNNFKEAIWFGNQIINSKKVVDEGIYNSNWMRMLWS